MVEEIEYCSFCKLLVKELKEGIGNFKGIDPMVREQYLDSMNKDSNIRGTNKLKELGPLMEVRGFCRGFGLCSKHSNTIKRDNKVRAKKGMDIPKNLSIIDKLRLYDW